MLLSPGHPFEVVDERYSYISLLSAEPSTDAVAGASVVRAGDDVWKVIGRELHIRYANGAGKAELSQEALAKRLGASASPRRPATSIPSASSSPSRSSSGAETPLMAGSEREKQPRLESRRACEQRGAAAGAVREDRRMPRPLPFGDRPFRVAADGAAGVSRSRTRAGDLRTPFRGVRMPVGDQDVRYLCIAYATKMPPDHFFSHHTAAALHGLPVPESAEIHVTSIAPRREPRARGVIGHRIAPGRVEVVTVGGLPVVAAVDTWVALAEYLSVEELVIVGDALVRRKRPLATMDELPRAIEAAAGRRGRRRLVEALAHVRPRTDSARETQVRRWLVAGGLPEPVVNLPILNARGAFVAFGDLSYPELRVLVEYDGGHHFTAEQTQLDIDRLEAIMALGWRVVRLNKTHSPAKMVTLVRAALVQRGWRP